MQPDNKSLNYMQETLNVSRETLAKLEQFAVLTVEWNKAINLVSPTTVPDLWWRHIVDSAQLYPLIPDDAHHIVDLGSGGGFPAIILAILANGQKRFTLIESDNRKCIFLREAIRTTGLTGVTVITNRIEKAPPQKADLVTARALASLTQLLDWAKPHGSRFLFPKGGQVADEIAELPADTYNIVTYPSVTDTAAKIVAIQYL